MSVPRRAYDLLRGYIGREYERIQGVDFDGAAQELKEAFKNPIKPGETPPPVARQVVPPVDRRAQACAVLGVAPDADFSAIRLAFQRLNRRSDPANFPSGSPERRQAGQIQRRVQDAYRVLADQADATEVRFKSLEID
ncbi:MAG: J domain-containing protein [Fimbriimonadaceae bacterium]